MSTCVLLYLSFKISAVPTAFVLSAYGITGLGMDSFSDGAHKMVRVRRLQFLLIFM